MIPDGALTVKEAGAITTKTENVSVVGQVAVYHYGNAYNGAASISSIILEDVIGGEIYGFQIYDYANHANYKVGDVVKVTGTISLYGGVPQMQSPAMEVVKAGVEAIPAQEITVSQMGADYLSEYVYIKDVTLGTYNASGSTPSPTPPAASSSGCAAAPTSPRPTSRPCMPAALPTTAPISSATAPAATTSPT